MSRNPGGSCRLFVQAVRLPIHISCDSLDRQRVCKVTELLGHTDMKNLPQSWHGFRTKFFPSRERWNMTYGGFSEAPLKGHFKWTTYQISNLFKAHDSHLLCAPRLTAREQRLSEKFSSSFGKAFVLIVPWKPQRRRWSVLDVEKWRIKWRNVNVDLKSQKTRHVRSKEMLRPGSVHQGPARHESWLIEYAICSERKIDTTCSQNFARFLRYGIREGNFLYSPNDIVDADDTLGLLFVEHYSRLCHNPHEAAVTCQEAISVSFSLTFADHWKDGNRGKNVISL